jgi:hypothetical protein
MIILKLTAYILAVILLFIFTAHAVIATIDPTLYGKYLQTMDNSRYSSPVFDQ